MGINLLLSVELIVIVSAEVMELITGQNKVNGNENRVGDSHSSAVLTAMRNQTRVLRTEKRLLVLDGGFGRLC